jgi:hypothetical protein
VVYPSLASASDLSGFEGAPFDDIAVSIACADVRAEAGWHIAPKVTETLTVASYGGNLLTLPTRRLVSVTAVRDVSTGSPVTLTDWTRIGLALYRGTTYRWSTGWPVGTLEVDVVHGYDTTPRDLLPVIVARVNSATTVGAVQQRSYTVGGISESETYRDETDPVLARYALISGVA